MDCLKSFKQFMTSQLLELVDSCALITQISANEKIIYSHALLFGNQKINLHNAAEPWEPHAKRPEPGSADLCFLTDMHINSVLEKLKSGGLEVLEDAKVVSRVGASGSLRSVYIRDPDGNLIELVICPIH
jgi:catechol 2,3-dioxygenase-like lactoylglutathione lyase family enzyme